MNNNINTDNMLRVGTVLHGTYRIDRYLSSGGFGNTYVATNIQFGEQYAIKEFFMRGVSQRDNNNTTVSVSNTDNRETFASQLEKFKKEARRLRKLNNEHIVRVHDLFEENGTAYYVMDYIDGENLSDRLKRTGKPLSEVEVMQLLPQILDALEAAHKDGILHLDLKPANIMVDKQGVVKLIDFGASKQQSVQGGTTTSTAVSYTNGFAPREQMEQNLNKFGPWTDIYALGATLYTLLTNHKPPLPSDIDDDGTQDRHLSLPMQVGISSKTKNLVLWLMSTSRTTRPQSVAEIRRYLDDNNLQDATTIDNDIYEGETVVGSKDGVGNPSGDVFSSRAVDEDNIAQSRKKKALKTLLYLLGGCAIGTIIFFIVVAIVKMSGWNPLKSSISKLPSDTLELVKKPIEVERLQCKVTQGPCLYTGVLNEDSIPNGEGEAWFNDGRYYKGNFDKGKMVDDNASFRYPNGDTYEGSFINDHFAKGKYTIAEDGSYYMGTYDVQGQPLEGTWYDKNGGIIESVK